MTADLSVKQEKESITIAFWKTYVVLERYTAALMLWTTPLLALLLFQGGPVLGQPSSAEYLRRNCAAHQATYAPLVNDYLSQFRDGFTVAQLLTLPSVYNGTRMQREFKGGMPLMYVIDGQLRVDSSLPNPGKKRLKNLEYFGMPVMEQLVARARLPDLALLYSPFDEPTGAPLPLLSHGSPFAAIWP